MSSAILYVAIVAIWAVVLIPRWLRRDSSERDRDATATGADTAEDGAEDTAADTAEDAAEVDEQPTPEPYARPRLRSRPEVAREPQAAREPREPREPRARGENGRREDGGRQEGSGDIRRDGEHARVLSARRRMLGLLVLIAIGSAALAVTRTAAWWVLGPPSAMLLGYLALLREASKADAERRELSRAGAGRVAVADQAVPAAAAAPAPAPVPAPAPAPRPVRVPDAEIIDISASRGPAGEGLYDQYADAKLRAVGD